MEEQAKNTKVLEKTALHLADQMEWFHKELEETSLQIADLNQEKLMIQTDDTQVNGLIQKVEKLKETLDGMKGDKLEFKVICKVETEGIGIEETHRSMPYSQELRIYGRNASSGAGQGDGSADTGTAMINNALTYGGTTATIAPFIYQMAVKSPKAQIQPHIALIATGVAAIVGMMQAASSANRGIASTSSADNAAFSDYVTDQFEGIKKKQQQELVKGSEMAYQQGDGYAYWNTILGKREDEFLTIRGDAYNNGLENTLKETALANTDELGDKKKGLNENLGLYEARKESEKMSIQTDIERMILGLEGDPDREYDTETKEQIAVLAARYQENNAIVEKYNTYQEALKNGEEVAEEDIVTEEELDVALAALNEVDGSMEGLWKNAYYKTDIAKADADADTQLIDDIQASSKDTLYTAGYDAGKNLSEGLETAILKFEPSIKEGVKKISEDLFQLSISTTNFNNRYTKNEKATEEDNDLDVIDTSTPIPGKAYGMDFVPYDGYTATLHWGERVLTASENRQYSRGERANQVLITGNTFNVRQESDIDKIAEEIVRKIALYNDIM